MPPEQSAFLQARKPAINMLVRLVLRPTCAIENACRSPAISNSEKSVIRIRKIMINMIDTGLTITFLKLSGTV